MSKTAINIHVQVFKVFSSFGYILRSAIAEAYGKDAFNFIRNCQTIFQNGCIILHSHQQLMRVLVALCPCQHLVLSVLWILAIIKGVLYWFSLSSLWHMTLSIFSYIYLPSACLYGEVSVQGFCPSFIWVVHFLTVKF